MRFGGGENLAEEVRDQDAACAGADDAADELQELPRGMRVERGGRLVEDDEVERVFGDGEGAGDLHHLAVPDRKIADDRVGRDAVARKDLVELAADQIAGPPAPAPALDRRMKDAGVLRDRQVRAERQLLEDAADAELLRQRHRVAGLQRSADENFAAVRRERAGKHVHQRRLAGAVVADEPHAFARIDGEIHAVERVDGAEMLFDAAQLHDVRALVGHCPRVRSDRIAGH